MTENSVGLTIVVEFSAHMGKEDELLQLVRTYLPSNALDPGLEAFSVHRDREQPNRFLFFEEWTSHAAFEASLRAPWRNPYFAAVAKLGDRTVRTFEPTDLRFPE
jgi:quinol monooxygenase YgiN